MTRCVKLPRVMARRHAPARKVRSRRRASEARTATRSKAMSTTKSPTQSSPIPPLDQIGARTLDAVSALAEANQRVVGQLIELTSSAAADRLRTLGELQSAAVEAVRSTLTPMNPRETFEEFRQDPFAWYRKSVQSVLDGTQRAFKLF